MVLPILGAVGAGLNVAGAAAPIAQNFLSLGQVNRQAGRNNYADYAKMYDKERDLAAKQTRSLAQHQLLANARTGGSAASQASQMAQNASQAGQIATRANLAAHEMARDKVGQAMQYDQWRQQRFQGNQGMRDRYNSNIMGGMANMLPGVQGALKGLGGGFGQQNEAPQATPLGQMPQASPAMAGPQGAPGGSQATPRQPGAGYAGGGYTPDLRPSQDASVPSELMNDGEFDPFADRETQMMPGVVQKNKQSYGGLI